MRIIERAEEYLAPIGFTRNKTTLQYQTACILLCGEGRRKHLSDLVNLTGYKRDRVQWVLQRAREIGLWQGESKSQGSDWDVEGQFLADLEAVLGRPVKV